MNVTLSTFMKLALVAVVFSVLIYGQLFPLLENIFHDLAAYVRKK